MKSSMSAVSWLRLSESHLGWKCRLAATRFPEQKLQRTFLALATAAQLKWSATTLFKLSVLLLRRKAFIKDKRGLTKCGSGESANNDKTLLAEENDQQKNKVAMKHHVQLPL